MKYVLSTVAEQDIEHIYDYGNYKFGDTQALKYLIELEQCIQTLCLNPDIGKSRNDIKQCLISFPFKSHIIFYTQISNYLRIIRILHCSSDIPNRLQLLRQLKQKL